MREGHTLIRATSKAFACLAAARGPSMMPSFRHPAAPRASWSRLARSRSGENRVVESRRLEGPEASRFLREAVMSTTTVELFHGLPQKELVERIHFYRRQGEVAERALGFYLLDMQERGAYRPEAGAAQWAWKHLDYKRADKLILLAKRLEELPEIDAAFSRGEVPWTKVREIARVAAPETEREWLALAKRCTSRELEAATAQAKVGDRPGQGLKARRSRY